MSDSIPAKVSRATESNDHVLRNEIYELFKECQSLRETLSAEMDENDRLRAENERLREKLDAVLSDWNGLVYVLGVNKYGAALDHARAMRRDAERYRFQRESDWRYRVEHYGASEDERAAYIDEYDANYDAAMKASGSPD